jgi:hypothetical protein
VFLDGNRTRILPWLWEALPRLSYQSGNRSTAAHPETATDKERTGIPATGWLGRDLNSLAVSRVADNPDPSAHRNWSGSRDLHPDRLLHRERCSCYTTILMEPLVGLAPTNTSLRNSPCSC